MSEFLRDVSAKIGLEIDAGGLEHFNQRLEGMHRSLEVVAGAEILKGLFELGEKFSGMGEQLETAAASAGITTTAFQGLAFAAAQSGIGQERLGMGLNMLARQIQAAREGSEGAADTFGKIGISPEQLAGFADSEAALKGVADRIAAIQDPIKRTQAAMKIFGRGGAQMVRFLAEGSQGVTADMRKAADLGAIVSAEQVEQLAKLEDALSAFGAVLKAAFATVAVYVAPIIKMVVKDLEDFWQANRKVINLSLKKWFGDLAYYIGFTVGFLQGLIKDFKEFIATFPRLSSAIGTIVKDLILFSAAWAGGAKILGVFKDAFGVLNGVLGAGKTAFELAGLASSGFFKVVAAGQVFVSDLMLAMSYLISTLLPGFSAALGRLGLALSATPVGVLVAGLAALIVVGHDLWKLFRGGDFWKDTWIGQGIKALGDFANGTYKLLFGKGFVENNTLTDEQRQQDDARRAKLEEDRKAKYANFGSRVRGLAQVDAASAPTLVNLAGANNPLYDTSPQASVAMNNTFNITAPPGTDAPQFAALIKDEFDKAHSRMLQQTQDSLIKPRVM